MSIGSGQSAGLASQFQRCPTRQWTFSPIYLTPCMRRSIDRTSRRDQSPAGPSQRANVRHINTQHNTDKTSRCPTARPPTTTTTMAAVTPSHAPHAARGKPTIPTSEQQQRQQLEQQRQQLEQQRQQAAAPWGPPDWVSDGLLMLKGVLLACCWGDFGRWNGQETDRSID